MSGPISERTLKQLTKYYPQGVLTASEVSQSIVDDFVACRCPAPAMVSAVRELPPEVQSALVELLRRIKEQDFRWRMVTMAPSRSLPESLDSSELRRIHDVLTGTERG